MRTVPGAGTPMGLGTGRPWRSPRDRGEDPGQVSHGGRAEAGPRPGRGLVVGLFHGRVGGPARGDERAVRAGPAPGGQPRPGGVPLLVSPAPDGLRSSRRMSRPQRSTRTSQPSMSAVATAAK